MNQIQLSMEANPTLDLEYAPQMVVDFKAFLASTGSGEAYAAQHSTAFLIVYEGDSISIRQVNPQAAQPANSTTEDYGSGGFVGSGGHNRENDTK